MQAVVAKPEEANPRRQRSSGPLLWFGLVMTAVVFAFVLRGFDWRRFLQILDEANLGLAALVPITIIGEQILRAIKWRELLRSLGVASIERLFGAIMAGYFANYFVPLRISFLVRAWLASRATGAPLSSVLGTVALDRVVDGLAFVPMVILAVATVSLGGDDGAVTQRLLLGAFVSLVALLATMGLLFSWAHRARQGRGLPRRLLAMLPDRWRSGTERLSAAFGEGLRLPRSVTALSLVFGSAILMKFVAAAHLGLAGLALSADIGALPYLFIMVCLGFMVFVASALKIVGGFMAGSIFLLQQFGVGVETATAMALLVSLSSRLTIIVTGAIALWTEKIAVTELRGQGRRLLALAKLR